MQSLGDVSFEYVMLKDADLSQCRGCFLCLAKGEEHCPIRDDAPAVEQKMHEADGVIFATPVYGMNVSGLMKIFVDRFSYIFAPVSLTKKRSSLRPPGSRDKRCPRLPRARRRHLGFEIASRVGIITPPYALPEQKVRENDRKLEEAARAFYKALQRRERRPPGLRDVIVFRAQRASFDELKDRAPADHAYWKEKGWFDPKKRYYVDVPVNPLYNAIRWVVEERAKERAPRYG